jgi:hypothetical protein
LREILGSSDDPSPIDDSEHERGPRPWTFAFERHGAEVARIEKKWAGLLTEAFIDADRFRILLPRPDLEIDERLLILAAAVFVDLQYFEAKAG